MRKEEDTSLGIPWGVIAFLSFCTGCACCERCADPGASPVWFDVMMGTLVVFGVSLFMWLLNFNEEIDEKFEEDHKKSGPMPWWYGGL